MSKWTQMVEYINSKPIGTIILRKDIEFFEDTYKLWLTHCRNLETISRGKYKILKHVDTNLTTNEIRKRAYDDEYRINEDRFQKLNDILK